MIPKNLHFIWVGSRDIPEMFLEGWKQTYSDYTITIWNDQAALDSHLIPNALQNDFYNNSLSPAFKADILRYFVVNRFGGLYFDMDFQCLKKIPDQFLEFSFLGGLQNNGEVAIGFFGSQPNSDVLNETVESLPSSIQRSKEQNIFNSVNIHKITGPEFFNPISRKYMSRDDYFFFDAAYFYPYWWEEPHRKNEDFKQTSPLAYGVHHWNQSWKLTKS